MIQEAIEQITGMARREMEPKLVHEASGLRHYLVMGAEGPEVLELKNHPPERHHVFASLEGFSEYLNSEHCTKDKGVVFVGAQKVFANLTYGEYVRNTATVELGHSEEYVALQRLFSGVNQKDLWRLLISDLHGCIEPALLLAIGQIRVKSNQDSEVQIDASGVTSESGASSITLAYPDAKGNGEQVTEIQLDWNWKGRIWDAYETAFLIPLRLKIEATDNGLQLRFHPRRLQSVLRDARLSLANYLKGEVPERFTVHEGDHG